MNTPGQARLLLVQQLVIFPNMSQSKAEAIANRFGSLKALIAALERQGLDAVASIRPEKSQRQIGNGLALKIRRFFCTTNPNELHSQLATQADSVG